MPLSLGAGQYIGTQQYRFPSVIWGNNQCLWPCRTGTMTTFTEAQETVSISSGAHNWKTAAACSSSRRMNGRPATQARGRSAAISSLIR
jgi:hypothetical protein